MKFLLIARDRSGPGTLSVREERVSSEVARQGVGAGIDAAKQWFKQKRASGEIEQMYAFVTGGGAGIANYNSHEALNAALRECPLSFLVEWEVYPLADLEQSFDAAKKAFGV